MIVLAPKFGHFQGPYAQVARRSVLDDHDVTSLLLVAYNGGFGVHVPPAQQRERRHCQRVYPNSCVQGGAVPSLISPLEPPKRNVQTLSTCFVTTVLPLSYYPFGPSSCFGDLDTAISR